MSEKIVLTPQELEDIKDTIGFRKTVLINLKLLSGVPRKVIVLGVHVGIQWFLIGGIMVALFFRGK